MVCEQRFVISARIIGSVLRDTPKLKMFMVSVLWSDEAEIIIYRSFQDFKKFHRTLKKRFPHVNPFRRNNRVIPKFNGKARRSLQQTGSKQAMQRMKFLESYCVDLLKCDQIVTQSSELTQFFMPKDHDLQTDYTKNSIMILLSDASDGGGDHQSAGSITHPLVTRTYRCVAAYETKDAKNRPFKVAVDEKLDVLIKDPAGWWLVENEEKRLAWFPAPYLELWDEEDDDNQDAGFQLGGTLYCTVRTFTASKDDEVSVPIGSVVEVLRKSDDGWWLVRFNGKGGYIPSMYLQPYNNPRAGLHSVQKKLLSSTLNLSATSSEPRSSPPPSINEENSPQLDSAGPSRGEPSVPGRLHKARSLDVLSESWTQAQQAERGPSTSQNQARRTSNISNTSDTSDTNDELSFSSFSGFSRFSSDSDSSSSVMEAAQQCDISQSTHSSPRMSPSEHRSSGKSTKSFTSAESSGSEMSASAPRVPPRPKTEEILTRCTTMTRKAAMATKTRLQIQPQSIQSR
ncbi:NADPH oxidase organizer 1-like [Notolabrus celidotus]|uniref:NADPH oxidase organizer 1-like n=1 Tax=Notolabrus celidotus TaxID=1203425 RepID=UPI001490630E|nr:NADPH oxidase organizer 1-like [Notolabrus celidotus]